MQQYETLEEGNQGAGRHPACRGLAARRFKGLLGLFAPSMKLRTVITSLTVLLLLRAAQGTALGKQASVFPALSLLNLCAWLFVCHLTLRGWPSFVLGALCRRPVSWHRVPPVSIAAAQLTHPALSSVRLNH
jgi:hypothetical protein